MWGRATALILAALLLGGCATKRDLRDLQTEIDGMRASQAQMLEQIREQNAMILDSLANQGLRMRGDFGNRLTGIERQLVQVQELAGQGQNQLSQLREQIRSREVADAVPVGGAVPSGPPEEVYNASLDALRRGSLSTARSGFEEFLRAFPQHPLAADAQFYIGETYEQGQDLQRALEAYSRVLELYPASARAPSALYQAGLIEIERGNPDRARTLLNQLVSAYPRSPEAAQATEQLSRLRG